MQFSNCFFVSPVAMFFSWVHLIGLLHALFEYRIGIFSVVRPCMQQRMQPPGDNSNGVHTARELKTVWLLGQVNCDISPLLPNSCRRACGCRSCIWFSHCVDQIASFPHLTCDGRPGNDAAIYTGSTCVILPPHLNFRLSRPQTKLSCAPCGLQFEGRAQNSLAL